jgi:hypothetical protein
LDSEGEVEEAIPLSTLTGTTRFYGNISAKGGAFSGNGGFVETSGRQYVDIGSTPDVTAPAGIGGEWLIDPNNIEIVGGGGNVNINAANPFASTDDTAQLGVDKILAALSGNADVTVATGIAGKNTQSGDITLSTPLDFNGKGTNKLTLNAHRSININQAITDSVAGGDSLNLVLNADQAGNGTGKVNINAAIATGSGSLTLTGASVNLAAATNWTLDKRKFIRKIFWRIKTLTILKNWVS